MLQEKEKDRTLELIKQQYLGAEKQKKKVMRPTEKFRFNFDWEAGDDTSRDLNPLTKETTEAALLFGRGMRAGVDRREQKKAAAVHEKEILRKMRESMVRRSCTPAPSRQHPCRPLWQQVFPFSCKLFAQPHWPFLLCSRLIQALWSYLTSHVASTESKGTGRKSFCCSSLRQPAAG